MATKVILEMTGKQFKRLAAYLAAHESDIAHHLDDYQELEDLFEAVFEEKPRKDLFISE